MPNLFDDIEAEQYGVGIFDIYNSSLASNWEDHFISGNAYYLWNKIRIRLEQFTPHDLSRLVDRYMNLKY